ncbi:MAG: metallophosphoesterase family protein [Myxococcota bacterium]
MRRKTNLRVGVISDIHADLGALERSLSFLVGQRIDRIVCLGDVVEKGDDGDAVVATLNTWTIPVVAGNHDHNSIRHATLDRPFRHPSVQSLRPETIAQLKTYPMSRLMCWEGWWVMMAHALPGDNGVYVYEDKIPRRLKKALRTQPADILMMGHTHRPMATRWNRMWLLNPGSVARARTRDSFTCGILALPTFRWTVYDLSTGAIVLDVT